MSRQSGFLKRLKLVLSVAVLFVVLLIKLRNLAPESFDYAVQQTVHWLAARFSAGDAVAHHCAVWLRAMLLEGAIDALVGTTRALCTLLVGIDAVASHLRAPRPAMSLQSIILVGTTAVVALGVLFSVADAVVRHECSGAARYLRWAALGFAWAWVYFWYSLVFYAYADAHGAFTVEVLRVSNLLLAIAALCIARCASLYLGPRAGGALTLLNIVLVVGAVVGRQQTPIVTVAVSLVAAFDMFLLIAGIHKRRLRVHPLVSLTAAYYAPALLIRPVLPPNEWVLVAYFLGLACLKLALWYTFGGGGDDRDDAGGAPRLAAKRVRSIARTADHRSEVCELAGMQLER